MLFIFFLVQINNFCCHNCCCCKNVVKNNNLRTFNVNIKKPKDKIFKYNDYLIERANNFVNKLYDYSNCKVIHKYCLSARKRQKKIRNAGMNSDIYKIIYKTVKYIFAEYRSETLGKKNKLINNENPFYYFSPLRIAESNIYSLFEDPVFYISENVVIDCENFGYKTCNNNDIGLKNNIETCLYEFDNNTLKLKFTDDMLAKIIAEMLLFTKHDDSEKNCAVKKTDKIYCRCVFDFGEPNKYDLNKIISERFLGVLGIYCKGNEIFNRGIDLLKSKIVSINKVLKQIEIMLNISPEILKIVIIKGLKKCYIDWGKHLLKPEDIYKFICKQHLESLKRFKKGVLENVEFKDYVELKKLNNIINEQIKNFSSI